MLTNTEVIYRFNLNNSVSGDSGSLADLYVLGNPYMSDKPARSNFLKRQFQELGFAFLQNIDGIFAIIINDFCNGRVHAITDRFSVIPLYVFHSGHSLIIGSHPDAMAQCVNVDLDFDFVTMAQVLQMWYASFPYTYYRSIRELDPASIHTWYRDGRYEVHPYWSPRYRGDESPGTDALAEELALAIRSGVQRRIAHAERPGLLLSAGADSRAILFAAAERKLVTTYTFYDEPNAELKLASRLASAVDMPHVPLQRDPEYYGIHARAAVRLMAGMWNFLDGHAVGFQSRFKKEGLDLLFSGDFADLLFKSNSLNISYRQFWGKNLPTKVLAPFSTSWRVPGMPIHPRLRPLVEERVAEQYAGIDTARLDEGGWWEVAHRRVGTLSRTSAIGGPISLQRALPWDTFVADRAMVAVYEQLTTDARVNASVWERAVRRLTPSRARNIPNNNGGARVGASEVEKVACFLYGVAYRKLFRRDIDGTPLNSGLTRGSWPNFAYYLAHSPVIEDLWRPRVPVVTDIICDLLGFNPWDTSTWDVRRAGMGFGRLLTLKLWLEDRFEKDETPLSFGIGVGE